MNQGLTKSKYVLPHLVPVLQNCTSRQNLKYDKTGEDVM